VPLSPKLSKDTIGNKASSLQFLKKNGCRIPMSFVVLSKVFSEYLTKPQEVLDQLGKELEQLPDIEYAVRSSTNLEDAEDFSHAGQFETFINIKGKEEILNAIIGVWDSAIPKANDEYFNKIGKQADIQCAVIIQKMVTSKIAGVSFSKNPVNNLNEVIIEAVKGVGENLVQKGETPHRWIVKNGKIQKGDEGFEHVEVIKNIAKTTLRLKNRHGKHIDIEWVFDGSYLYLLQLRSITSKSDEMVYSQKMAKEFLPGQIKPLVWSINIPLVNGMIIDILSNVIGKIDFEPEDLAKSFYYRTYFNVTNLGIVFKEFGVPLERLEEMMLSEEKTNHTFKPGFKTIKHTFRLIKFVISILRFEKFYLKEYDFLKIRIKEMGLATIQPGQVPEND